MSKTAQLLCTLTTQLNLQDQWRLPAGGVIGVVRASAQDLIDRAAMMAKQSGRQEGKETLFRIDGLNVAVSPGGSDTTTYVAISSRL